MEPYLCNEQEEIREWGAKVFVTLFQRQPEKAFVEPILRDSIIGKLKECVQTSNEVDAERIISVLKNMIVKCSELKIENKLINLCEITDKTTNLTIP